MNTSMLAIALAAVVSIPTWQTSYETAQQNAAALKRPLVVIFGSGLDGWTKVVRDQKATAEISKLLAENYIYVYVDTHHAEGKKIAQSFEVTGNVGVVISDRSGSRQAFWHQGDMTNESLTRYLQKYADPNVAVQGTETVATPRVSYYPNGSTGTTPTRTVNC